MIYVASAFGYKKNELKGWIRLNVILEDGCYSAGLLVIPDDDWDSMAFLFERGLFYLPQATEHHGLIHTSVPAQNGYAHSPCCGGLEESSPFQSAKKNQSCKSAALMLMSPNLDLTRLGIIGYNFPKQYIQRGMKILESKLAKIPVSDLDTSISVMSKTASYDMGCVCVEYGKHRQHEPKGFLAVPMMNEQKIWDWTKIGEFECGNPVDSFPGSVLRICPVVKRAGLFKNHRPIGGYAVFKKGVLGETKKRLSRYEGWLNAYKPLGLGLQNDDTYVRNARNSTDRQLKGSTLEKRNRKTHLEWRKL